MFSDVHLFRTLLERLLKKQTPLLRIKIMLMGKQIQKLVCYDSTGSHCQERLVKESKGLDFIFYSPLAAEVWLTWILI